MNNYYFITKINITFLPVNVNLTEISNNRLLVVFERKIMVIDINNYSKNYIIENKEFDFILNFYKGENQLILCMTNGSIIEINEDNFNILYKKKLAINRNNDNGMDINKIVSINENVFYSCNFREKKFIIYKKETSINE